MVYGRAGADSAANRICDNDLVIAKALHIQLPESIPSFRVMGWRVR